MLHSLFLKNFLLVEKAHIHFDKAITVLTGETGAGKSILINALSLVLGSRGSSSWVGRHGDTCEIIAEFNTDDPIIQAHLQELSIESDRQVIFRRILSKDSHTKAYINDTPVAVKTLKLIGECLVDIYGQHSHYALLKPEVQRQKLDSFGKYQNQLNVLKTTHYSWSNLQARFQNLKDVKQNNQDRLELLHYQLEEFYALDIKENEFAELEQDQAKLSKADRLRQSLEQSVSALYADDISAISMVESSLHRLEEFAEQFPNLGNVVNILQESTVGLHDAVDEIKSALANISIDAESLAHIEERLGAFFDLSRKHRCKPDELLSAQQIMQSELDQIEIDTSSINELEVQIETSWHKLTALADQISHHRQIGAKQLSAKVTEQIQTLGMQGAKFEAVLNPLPNGRITAYGQEQVVFKIETNIGYGLNDLSKSASGGELSRLGLAVQVCTARMPDIGTLVMDEIDVGIGGETANRVAHLLKELAQKAQIICVTHLPQIASIGAQNIKIDKQIIDNTTRHSISTLDESERVDEIARMLGGSQITENIIKHAQAMLDEA